MIRRILMVVVFVFVLSAATVAVDWAWFHGLRACFGPLERHAGFWALAVVCAEVFFILAAMYRLTESPIIHRWLMTSSWLLPSYLFTAYLCQGLSAEPKSIHSLEGFYAWQTAAMLQSQQIHSARALPLLTFTLLTFGAVKGFSARRRRHGSR